MSFNHEHKPTEWLHAELRRFKLQLPIEHQARKNHPEKSLSVVQKSIVNLSQHKFDVVVWTLVKYANDIGSILVLPVDQHSIAAESNLIVLETIEECFEKFITESAQLTDEMVQKRILPKLCSLALHPEASSDIHSKGAKIAGRIIYLISKHHFSSVFSRISNRFLSLTSYSDESPIMEDLELIRYLHVPIEGLILLFQECSNSFKNLKKNSQVYVLKGLCKAIWNWIETYPEQLTLLYKQSNIHLSELSDKLFTTVDQWLINHSNRKAVAWPIQILLILLSPLTVQEASGGGQLTKGSSHMKRQFLDNIKKSLQSSRSSPSLEHALLACVHLCKASTFIAREDNIICFLVSEVLNELKTLLFTSDKPFVSSTGLQVDDLMVDLFVASFRINYRNSQHFEICFQPDTDPYFQIALVKGIYQIIQEVPLKWWPSKSVIYSRSTQVRNMFQQCIRRMTSFDSHIQKSASYRSSLNRVTSLAVTRKKEDPGTPSFGKDAELLLWLVKLFHKDPEFALNNPDKNAAEIQASSMQIMNGLIIIMMFTNIPDVSLQVSEALLTLHSPENIELWNPEAPMATFWEISSHIVYNVADRLLSDKMPDTHVRAMRWLQEIMKCRIEFIESNMNMALMGTHMSICTEALTKLEIMFLNVLWSTDAHKVLLSMKCFGLLNEECNLLTGDRPSPIHPAPISTVYYKLADEVKQTGRTALHKRIMSILKEVNVSTPGNIKAWEIGFAKWQKMTHYLTNYPREEFSTDAVAVTTATGTAKQKGTASSPTTSANNDFLEQYLSEWAKLTGFLCSLGAIFVSPTKETKDTPHNSRSRSSTAVLEDSPVNRFISELLTLLVCCNEHTSLNIRSTVKEALGFDLSTPLYPSFFFLCKATTACFFDSTGQVNINTSHTIYVEQLIYVLRCILENKSNEVSNILSTFPVEDIILAKLRYIRALNVNVQTLVIKSKMCQLVENIMLRRSDISFRQEMKFRNTLLLYLCDWVLHSSEDTYQNTSKEVHAISCTLDEAAMKAIAILLKGLPLQPDNSDQDITEAKSDLFLKHFTLFMNILNKCYGATDDKKNNNTKQSTSLAPHFVKLRQSTVKAMSNMLSANIDSGLMHSVGLAYHGDTQTRATFLEVLTEILKQGTEFENLAENVLEDRFERMVCLLLQANEREELPITMALCNAASSNDMDEVSQVLVNIFDARGSLHLLLWNLFRDEVDKCEGQQTLFRGNTIASKAMTYSFKMYGSGYLHLLLTPLLKEMTGDQNKTYEVDSARLENGENKADNAQNLIELANKFMEKVKVLKDSFPPQLQSLCYCLNKAVQRRFPSTSYDAVASAVFLRFINPAIVSPASQGIVTHEIHPNARRGLMLLSKILQNLANHLHFTKEAHMEVFNGFLENNFHRIHSFFREISSKPGTISKDKEEIIPLSYSNDSNVLALHKLLWLNQEKMAKSLAKDRSSDGVGSRDPFDKLVTLLAHLGPPENQHTKLAQRLTRERANSIGWRFEEFMARHAGQNQDELEQLKTAQLFYGDGKSIAGRPVFYYIARRYINDQVSDEVLLYHILLTLQPKYGQPWELVVDLTHTARENRFKLETIAKAFVILPESQIKHLHVMYFYNMSTSLRQYVELNERVMRPLKNNSVVVIIEKLSKFYDYISPDELKLPGGTLKLEDDTKSYQVAKISSKGSIILRINATAVQITQTEKVKILGYPVILNDIFYASEIERASSHDEILELNFSTNRLCMKFYTSQAEEIANSISHIQARWKLSQPDKKAKLSSKKIRPKDVPGTLLNMALINLGNNDPNLRLAAYNLLCALTATFGLRVNERLLEAKGICIPVNCTVFIYSISQQLSEREPALTLEFLDECISCLDKTDDESRNLCLNYIEPWLPNLARFASCSKNDPDKIKMMSIIEKLIKLTISNRKNYPFIQSSVWGNIGKIPDLLDVVFDLFVKTSSTGGFGSEKAEVMADTTVTLASANIPLVSKKLLDRFHKVIDRTNVQPTKLLERHLMWDDIAILARYLLMLSFNNSVDVSHHLPDIFHIVTLLVATGPASLRASIHGLVINSLQSVLTCSDMVLSADTQLLIKAKLEDLSLQKFYLLFGISSAKSAPVKAFPTNPKGRSRTFNSKLKEDEQTISLTSLELVTEVLLDVVDACMIDLTSDQWLKQWRKLCSGYAFVHNPAIQSRCIVVMGTICKQVHDRDIVQMLEVLAKACGFYLEHQLIEAVLMCLAKYQAMLLRESDFHTILFWVAVGVLQFGEQNLYPSALNLLQKNLHTCHSLKVFSKTGLAEFYMSFRKDNSLMWIFKQLDHMCGLNFSNNFNFALAALLLKGLRHPLAKTKSTTLQILNQLVAIGSNQVCGGAKEKFDVNKETVPYLAVLLPLDEETRLQLNSEQITFVAKSFTLKRTKSKALLLDKSDRKPSVTITVSGTEHVEDESLGEKRYMFESATYNQLLNPEILSNQNLQALLVVLLATIVDHTMDDLEMRILFDVLAEASILYPEVFPIAYSILNRKICNVISHSDDNDTLESVQTIVHSTSSLKLDKPTIKSQYLTSIGFHGIHSFPGPFTEAADPIVAPQMFARFVDGVLTKYTSVNNLSSDGRSVSGNLFKPPTYVDDNILCTTSTSSTSLNTIQASSEQASNTTTNIFSVFKRVGSYSPARRQKKGTDKSTHSKANASKEVH